MIFAGVPDTCDESEKQRQNEKLAKIIRLKRSMHESFSESFFGVENLPDLKRMRCCRYRQMTKF